MQQWTLQGTQIVNKQNNYCLSAGPQSCGRWSNCNKSLVQTRQNNTILNVYAEPCNPSNVAQQWSLGPAPNSTLIDFTPLNVSAAKYPAPVNSLAAQAYSNSHQANCCLYILDNPWTENLYSFSTPFLCPYLTPRLVSAIILYPGCLICPSPLENHKVLIWSCY